MDDKPTLDALTTESARNNFLEFKVQSATDSYCPLPVIESDPCSGVQ